MIVHDRTSYLHTGLQGTTISSVTLATIFTITLVFFYDCYLYSLLFPFSTQMITIIIATPVARTTSITPTIIVAITIVVIICNPHCFSDYCRDCCLQWRLLPCPGRRAWRHLLSRAKCPWKSRIWCLARATCAGRPSGHIAF